MQSPKGPALKAAMPLTGARLEGTTFHPICLAQRIESIYLSFLKTQLMNVGGTDVKEPRKRSLDIVMIQLPSLIEEWGAVKIKYCFTYVPEKPYFANSTVIE